MGLRSVLAKPLAALIEKQNLKWAKKPVETQQQVFSYLLENARKTQFGRDHRLQDVNTFQEWKEAVAVRDYEGLKTYFDQTKSGVSDVLWPGKPIYLAKTSGTTSGVKYIPITKESVAYHVNSARNAVFSYIHETGHAKFLDKKLIFLSGSPALTIQNDIQVGRLSGIVNHHVPSWLRTNQLPSYQTNCIEDWETKLDAIIEETIRQPMGLISGIPPWVQMYFDRIQAKTGKKISEVFPDFSVFVYGGVNFEPYRKKLFESIGKPIASIETYPASEGFFAYQDSQDKEGLLLLLDSRIFYEFIPVEEYFHEKPSRLDVSQIEIGKNYALVVSSSAGLWSYSMGDTVRVVNLHPIRVKVSGRIKHFISAFGEHVIGEEVEKAMQLACKKFPEVEIVEFTVAPMVEVNDGLPHHEWLIEFAQRPHNLPAFERTLNEEMVKLNIYYKDLIEGSILECLKVTPLSKDAFIDYMRSEGKLGGQNKVPRLSNDRALADKLVR